MFRRSVRHGVKRHGGRFLQSLILRVTVAVFPLSYWLTLCALAVVAWLAWGKLRRAAWRRRVATARGDFAANRAAYERAFFSAAASGGKPRGLRWKECQFHDGPPMFARDRATGELVALAGVTIAFEAVEGGGMEDVEAVGNRRCATAVFTWDGQLWTTSGRAAFNLEPHEVVARYGESLELIPPGDA